MVTEQDLRAVIDANIINNDTFYITPGKLRQVLVSHIDWANQNVSAALQGIATNVTNPGTHVAGRWWFMQSTNSAQTFTNFGLSLGAGEFALAYDNGTTYIKMSITDRYVNIADDNPGSNLFNGVAEVGLWDITTGAAVADFTSVRTQKLAVLPNVTYSIAGYGSQHSVVGYKNLLGATYDQTFITTPITGGFLFTTGPNTTYVAINLSNTAQSLVTLAASFQLNLGSSILAYEAPGVIYYTIKPAALPNYYNKTYVDAIVAGFYYKGLYKSYDTETNNNTLTCFTIDLAVLGLAGVAVKVTYQAYAPGSGVQCVGEKNGFIRYSGGVSSLLQGNSIARLGNLFSADADITVSHNGTGRLSVDLFSSAAVGNVKWFIKIQTLA